MTCATTSSESLYISEANWKSKMFVLFQLQVFTRFSSLRKAFENRR